ncbi:hypothetical protein AIOGIFDO_01442 [Candidatus Methanoperedenaceae archaeon GB37]|nr:hypothetical protein AIOGIFDO_01442 [Candidatus Methanoperedenaceae archaeon GB37]
MLKALVRQTKKSINGDDIDTLYGDGGYDSKDNFNLLDEEGIKAVIKTRKNSSTKAKGISIKSQDGERNGETRISIDMVRDEHLKPSFLKLKEHLNRHPEQKPLKVHSRK